MGGARRGARMGGLRVVVVLLLVGVCVAATMQVGLAAETLRTAAAPAKEEDVPEDMPARRRFLEPFDEELFDPKFFNPFLNYWPEARNVVPGTSPVSHDNPLRPRETLASRRRRWRQLKEEEAAAKSEQRQVEEDAEEASAGGETKKDKRALAGDDDEDDDFDNETCVLCTTADVDKCQILSGLLIDDKVYPENEDLRGSCELFEQRAERLESVFGPDATFRDTTNCRDRVYQYMCLFWASDNSQYSNPCQDVSDPDESEEQKAPKMPCRRFCVQIAEMCANDPSWMDLCYNIHCCESSLEDPPSDCIIESEDCEPYPQDLVDDDTAADDGDDEDVDDVREALPLGECEVPSYASVLSAAVPSALGGASSWLQTLLVGMAMAVASVAALLAS